MLRAAPKHRRRDRASAPDWRPRRPDEATPTCWTGLDPRAWTRLRLASGDELVIGPSGLHLIRAHGPAHDPTRRTAPHRGRLELVNHLEQVEQVRQAAAQLAVVVGVRYAAAVTASLLLPDSAPPARARRLLGPTGRSTVGPVEERELDGVLCARRGTITHAIRHRPAVLSAGQVEYLTTRLSQLLAPGPGHDTARRHRLRWARRRRRAAGASSAAGVDVGGPRGGRGLPRSA